MTSIHLAELADGMDLRFTSSDAVRGEFIALCKVNPEYASYHCIGFSEEGRPIDAVILGSGKTIVSLIAGAHSDEPVGPQTLRIFIIQGIKRKNDLKDLFETYKFVIIPQINPDGEIKNLGWTKEWPNFECYLKHAFRELPGRDIEFGFPEMRKENQAVSRFIKEHAPVKLHLSLHGMGYSEGAMLLIERHWIDRTIRLRKQFKEFVNKFGLGIHDHDRKGEKGFIHIEPGFTTTPEGRAMQAFFYQNRDDETAKLFHLSSMEWVRTLGENPLCLVTELPLFLIQKKTDIPEPGVPKQYMALKELIPSLNAKLRQGHAIAEEISVFELRPVPITDAIKIQLQTIQLGLEAISTPA